MKRKFMAVFATVLVLALAWVGAVYAQEDPGYPVETETPTETEVPTETEAPTETETPTETEAPVLTETPVPTESPTEDPTEMPTEEPTEEPTETPVEENPVCLGTRVHPVLAGLAIRYDVAYEEVVGMFCSSNLGVGEIALALATVQQAGGEVSFFGENCIFVHPKMCQTKMVVGGGSVFGRLAGPTVDGWPWMGGDLAKPGNDRQPGQSRIGEYQTGESQGPQPVPG